MRRKPVVLWASLLLLLLRAPLAFAADPIFDPNVLHEIRIVIDPADWQALIDNFRSNQYYAANASIDGEVIQQIGIRSAGKGSRSDQKPYVKLDFNKYVSGQKFHGQKSVRVKNLVQDQSMLRDYLSMAVFNAMGIPTPSYAFARVTVNDTYFGVFNLVEAVEEPFLDLRYGNHSGNLYKYEYSTVYNFTSKGGDAGAYVPDPFKPETDNTTDFSRLVAFIQAINGGSDATFATDIAAYLDVQQFLTYIATENAVAESDGILGTEGMNNFYLYQTGDKFILIAWDKNTSFNSPTWPVLRNVDANVLARRLLADPAQKQFYLSQIKRATTSYVNSGFLGPKLEAAYNLIHAAAIADTKKPYTNDQFEVSVSGLRGIIGARQADVASQIP